MKLIAIIKEIFYGPRSVQLLTHMKTTVHFQWDPLALVNFNKLNEALTIALTLAPFGLEEKILYQVTLPNIKLVPFLSRSMKTISSLFCTPFKGSAA